MFLVFIFLVAAYLVFGVGMCVFSAWLLKRLSKRNWIAGAALVLVGAAVFGEEIFTFLNWQYKCRSEAGVHVYTRVPVSGFLMDGAVSKGVAREFLGKGTYGREMIYDFVEGYESGKLHRYTSIDGGRGVAAEVVTEIKSAYGLSVAKIDGYPRSPWKISRVVYELYSGNVAGESKRFGYHGGLIISYLRRMSGADKEGSASYCGVGRGLISGAIPYSSSEKIK